MGNSTVLLVYIALSPCEVMGKDFRRCAGVAGCGSGAMIFANFS